MVLPSAMYFILFEGNSFIFKSQFSGLLDGCSGAVAPSAPSQRELAKIFDFCLRECRNGVATI